MFCGAEYPCGHFRSAVLAMVPPIFLCTCSLAKHGKPKSPSERVNTTQQQWKQCGIIFLILNSQCSTVSATRSSNNSIPSESGMISTPYFLYLLCHTQVLFFAVTSYSDTVTFPVFWYMHTHPTCVSLPMGHPSKMNSFSPWLWVLSVVTVLQSRKDFASSWIVACWSQFCFCHHCTCLPLQS